MSGEIIPEPKVVDAEVCPEPKIDPRWTTSATVNHNPNSPHADLNAEEIQAMMRWIIGRMMS